MLVSLLFFFFPRVIFLFISISCFFTLFCNFDDDNCHPLMCLVHDINCLFIVTVPPVFRLRGLCLGFLFWLVWWIPRPNHLDLVCGL
ncbi:hypothetical protein BDN72DRAFT_111949 [Pluteus cervinus]|uniref:Uncharacterized protein n=1 Tax=Pluteus cervinus TaxID=181527 RepID=A0ACD3AN62_9AGAR|nr:hypothetical protein BDN72DRAFT_111949 [Pluteus cervinus]